MLRTIIFFDLDPGKYWVIPDLNDVPDAYKSYFTHENGMYYAKQGSISYALLEEWGYIPDEDEITSGGHDHLNSHQGHISG